MGRRREIVGIFTIALAVLIIVSLHTTASGAVGAVLAKGLRRAFGYGADVPALFLFFIGVGALKPKKRQGDVRRVTALVLAYVILLTGYHLIATGLSGPLGPYWALRLAEESAGGGAVGGVIGARLLQAFGAWGSAVVLLALLATSVTLYMETPLSRIVQSFSELCARLFKAALSGAGGFVSGVMDELRELVAMIKDRRARASSEREAALAAKATERRSAAAQSGGASNGKAPAFALFKRKSSKKERESDWEADFDEKAVVASEGPRASKLAKPKVEVDAADAWPDAIEEQAAPAESQPEAASRNRSARRKVGVSADPSVEAPEELQIEAEPAAPQVVYALPPAALLARNKDAGKKKVSEPDQSQQLEETLATFGVQAKVVKVSRGPVVTRYELQPAPGIKVSKIVNLADDVALSLAAEDVRIEAPVPGKSVVGIEVPNKETTMVYMRDIVEAPEFRDASSKLSVGLGKDIAGNVVIADLTKLLHVLIAGATGSGKSVCINTLICSILYRAKPDEVKLLMIDPKRVELAVYDGIPHLITPVVTDPKLASNALRWAVKEMESRYKKFSETGVRNIDGYNRGVDEGQIEDDRMSYLVVIVDELADLMMVAGNEVEDNICRLAQMARAAGIHLVIATQRPSVDVITGLIKANVPSRISFAVSSGVDSRTILDMVGAERLIGKGDMLYYPIGASKPLRAQGAWISDKEVQEVVDFWKKQGDPQYAESVTELPKGTATVEEGDDELFEDAVQLVVETGNASISMLQRRFRVGYARAARLIDMMELQGIVGPYQGSKPREVLRTVEDLEEIAN